MANIIGTPGDDNPLTGTNGKDRIEGGDGNDVINGSGGIDQLFGDAGDDILNGGLGNDRLVGGAGTDTAVFAASAQAASTGAAPVASFVGTNLQIDAGAEGIDVLSLVEQVSFNGMVFQVDTPSLNVVANLGADTNSMNEDGGPIAGNVLANDYDLDSLLQVTGVSHGSSVGALGSPLQGDHGVLTLNANGTYTYEADPDAAGVDTFTYSVVDGGVTRTVTLTITVNPENDAPVADDSSNSGDEDTDIVGTVTATDVDGPDVTYSLDTGPSNGSVVVNADGTYTYTPDADFYGTDSFTFTASDGSLSDTGTVTLTVNPVSDVIIVGAGGFATIQEAVDAAEDGDTIMIEAGTYREQVIVDGKSISIIAADGAVLEAPDHGDIVSAGGRFSILTAMNGANLTVENLTIDGRSQGDGFETQTFAGVAFLDSDGSFTGGTITNFVDSSFNGAQHGYGVIIRSTGGAHTVEISDTVIDNFQKNGIDARGAGLVVNLSGNTITGQGLTTLNAQNGIALVSGVTGVVDGNTISGIGYDGGSTAVGVLLHTGVHGVTVTDNTITMAGEGSGIHLVSSDAGTITGNSVSDAISGIAQEGTFTVEVTTAEDNSYSNVEYQLDLFPNTGDATPRDFEGTTGDDYLGGGAGEDTLDGGEGNDELAGFGGADTINGGAGDDLIDGGSGDDVLTGGEGSDTITGGDGVDTAVVAGDATIELVGGAWQVTSDDGVDTVAVEQVQDDGGTVLLVGAGGFATIQEAIDAASAGDTILIAEGTYSENVLVNKDGLTITGVGNVVLEGTFKTDNGIVGDVNTHLETAVAYDGGAGAAFSVSGSNVTFNNIDISSFHTGVLINGDITGLTLNDVNVSDGIFGLTKELDNASVDGLTINDGSFTHLHIGVDLSKNPAISGNDAINVLIDGTHFEDITAKGFYAETLTNGHLTNFTMTNVGYFGGTPSFGAFAGAGVEINLKTGSYSGIEIDNFVMTNVGQSMRFGQPHDNAAAISIKPRDDSGAYTPVEITDAVSIHDGVIDGTSTGIRTGESGKVNATGDLDIDNVVITNAYNDAQNGDLENRSEAEINLTGTDGDDTYVVSPQSVGEITINGGDGADTLTGNGSGDLTFNGEGGDDVLTGGSGDDVLTGGEGSDTITGGDGVDTAVVAGDATIELVGGAWQVTSDDGVDTVAVEQVQDDGGTVLLVGAGGFATIQEAIDAASAGDTILIAEGTYSENVLVNKDGLTITGVGNVVLEGTFKTDNGIVGDVNTHLETAVAYDGGAGAAFSVSGSNVTFNNIDISSFHTGVLINGDITGLTLNDVNVSDGIFGLTKELDNASVDGLTINDGSFTHLHIGVDLSKNPAISGNDAINVLIDGTHFEDITAKGFYAETLTNGHLTNFTMTNVGYFGGTPSFGAFAGAGVEINLKTGSYSGIEIDNFVMTNVGQSMRFGQPHDNAAAISIKPRDDSGAYTPVEITDAVSIHDGVIDGTSTGIRTGESGRVNATGDLDIDNVVITNAYNDAQNGDLENRSEAEINLTGTDSDDTYVVSPQSVGEITINGGDGADTLTGNGTGDLTFNGEGGDDVLTGGSGDDVLTGGEGSDTITGGDGVDTAVVAGDATIELVGGAWQVTSDDGVDTVAVEQVQDDGGTVLLVGAGGFATIQDAINAASAGDTIYVAEGTYAENLVVNGKPLNFVAVGEVVIDAAAVGTTVLVTGDFGGGDLSFDGFTITGSTGGIITGGMYVNATGIGDMTLDNCTFEDNAYAGFYIYNAGIENLLIEDSVFDDNGETGLNSGGHIKLMGLTGNANLRELTLSGAPDGTGGINAAGRPDYGIEIHGIENIELTGGADTAPIGNVVIENVTITGEFHKSAFAINNYQNLDGLSITNLDLSTASADWNIETTSVLNVDGIRESYDASAWDISLPDQVRATSLRGEHGTESPADQTITGTSSDDQIWGNGGADLIIGGAGDDVIDGQADSDTVVITGLSTDATGVQAGAVLTVTSADGVDTLTNIEAIQFDDRTISVNNGNAVVVDELEEVSVNENAVVNGNVLGNAFDLDADTLTVTALLDPNNDPVAANGSGAFLVMGAHGFLLLQANGAFSYTATDDSLNPGDVVTETFTYTVSDGADEAVQTLTVTVNGQAEAMVGTNGVDSLSGSEGDDFIFGLGGNDTLQGLGGDDVIYGGAGNDVIVGGAGDDEMIGEGGNDSYNVDSVGDVVIEEAGGGTDTVSASIDYVLGENLENLRLLGSDDLDGTGNAANNSLYGNTGANTLSGMDGNDNLRGGDGNDVLIGGRGNDNLYGEAGGDLFVFLNESIKTSGTRDIDQVRDFNHLDGDRIDLSAIDADITTDGDQAFTFVGAFSGVAGQALMILAAGQTLVRLDVNGDGQHDLQIQLLGDHTSAPVLTGSEDPSEGGWIL
ncbi:MAG: Ig-like domain-containing protein [Caulobacter sp.]